MELVTIIVPVYNVEKYLRECLDSILTQTYGEIEVIMVDDGSEDSSGRICDEYAAMHYNFKVIHKQNAGLGMARNSGLENMNGEYVTFLDADDYIAPDLVMNLVKYLKKANVDMCKGGFQQITNEKKILSVTKYEEETFSGSDARNLMLPRMIGSRPDKKDSIEMCVCGTIYRASHIKNNNLRFPSERELISEDLVFNIDYMQYANGACTIPEVGYNYRSNDQSLTQRYRPDRFHACKHFFIEINKKISALGYDRMAILRLHRMFFIYLMMCISQENTGRSGLTRKECIQNIRKICSDETTQQAIRSYPRKHLGLRQNIFLTLVQSRMARVLYCLNSYGTII